LKLIGKGTFAKVYLIERISDKEQFAVKIFTKTVELEEGIQKAGLILEINILRQIKHEHLITFHEVYETSKKIMIL